MHMPRQIYEREQHVPKLGLDRVCITLRNGFVEFSKLFGDFRSRPSRVWPIKPYARHFFPDSLRTYECG